MGSAGPGKPEWDHAARPSDRGRITHVRIYFGCQEDRSGCTSHFLPTGCLRFHSGHFLRTLT